MSTNKAIIEQYLSGPQGLSMGSVITENEDTLRIISLTIHFTYRFSGLIYGFPNEKINNNALIEIKRFIDLNNYQKLPVYIEKPKNVSIQVNDKKIQRLPLMFYIVELESSRTDQEHTFSSLVHVRFHDEIWFSTIEKILSDDLKFIDWKKYAKNWNP